MADSLVKILWNKIVRIASAIALALTLSTSMLVQASADTAKYLSEIRNLRKIGQYENAAVIYTKLIELNPDDSQFYFGRAGTYDKLHQYTKAVADYRKAEQLREQKFADGRVDPSNVESVEVLSKEIEIDPSFGQLYLRRSIGYSQRQQPELALADLGKVIELEHDNAEVYQRRCLVFEMMGRLNDAIADATKIIEINPKRRQSYLDRGNIYTQDHQYDKAIEDYRTASKLLPEEIFRGSEDWELVNFQFGTWPYTNSHALKSFVANLTEEIRIEPNLALLYELRGGAYYRLAPLDKAAADFTKSLALEPNNYVVLLLRAFIYQAQKKYSAATVDFTRALQCEATIHVNDSKNEKEHK